MCHGQRFEDFVSCVVDFEVCLVYLALAADIKVLADVALVESITWLDFFGAVVTEDDREVTGGKELGNVVVAVEH